MVTAEDKSILRELAKQVADIAALDINKERIARIRKTHSLKPGRPVVWIEELPWHEMDIDGALALRCESKEGQDMERNFRRILYRWKYIQVDMVVEDTFYIGKAADDSGNGMNYRRASPAVSDFSMKNLSIDRKFIILALV